MSDTGQIRTESYAAVGLYSAITFVSNYMKFLENYTFLRYTNLATQFDYWARRLGATTVALMNSHVLSMSFATVL